VLLLADELDGLAGSDSRIRNGRFWPIPTLIRRPLPTLCGHEAR